jgi:HNH endonuclease
MLNLEGKRFGYLTVMRRTDHKLGKARGWVCLCDCGTVIERSTVLLTRGACKSCGCKKSEMLSQSRASVTHTRTKHEALMSRVVAHPDGCWEWLGRTDKDGYGIVMIDGKNNRAHRLSYVVHRGDIPDGMVVCHKCDNPPCCNPSHLFLGTIKDNANDALAKGRAFVGEKNGRAKLSWHDIGDIRSSTASSHELSLKYAVSVSSINRIKRNQSWRA